MCQSNTMELSQCECVTAKDRIVPGGLALPRLPPQVGAPHHVPWGSKGSQG